MRASHSGSGLVLLGLMALFLACDPAEDSGEAPPEVAFDTCLQLDKEFKLESEDEGLLGRPNDVNLDETGRIFVADQSGPDVRVYDADGRYERTIGGQGEGPGEFQRIGAMEVGAEDRLYVFDSRRWNFEEFTTGGEHVRTISMPTDEGGWVTAHSVEHLGGARFVLEGHQVGSDDRPTEHVLHYVHLTDEQDVRDHFLSVEDDLDPQNNLLKYIAGTRGSLLASGTSTVLYAPRYYDGRIFHFRYDSEAEAWHQEDVWEGYVDSDEPVELVDPDAFDPDDPDRRMVQVFWQEEQYAGIVQNGSHGLFELEDGRVAHFTHLRVDGAYQFGVELFAPDGERIGYDTLSPIGRESYGADPYQVAARGEDNRFYVIDAYAEPPAVHVARLDYECDD